MEGENWLECIRLGTSIYWIWILPAAMSLRIKNYLLNTTTKIIHLPQSSSSYKHQGACFNKFDLSLRATILTGTTITIAI